MKLTTRPRPRYVRLPRPRPPRDRGGWTCGLALGLLLVGCRSTLDPASGDPRLDLQHPDPRVRIDAAGQAVRQSRLDLCGLLVRNLSDRDGAVRLFSSIALRKLTAQDFGYKAHGTLVEREESIERWTRWLESEGLLSRDLETPQEPPPPESTPDSGEGESRTEEREPPSPLAPAVPLDSAGNPGENDAPREKKSVEKADDSWVGSTSKAARS